MHGRVVRFLRQVWLASAAQLGRHYPRALCPVISACTGPSQPEVWLLSPQGLTRLGTPNRRSASASDPPSSWTAWLAALWASAGRQEADLSACRAVGCVFAVRCVHGFARRGARHGLGMRGLAVLWCLSVLLAGVSVWGHYCDLRTLYSHVQTRKPVVERDMISRPRCGDRGSSGSMAAPRDATACWADGTREGAA